MKLINKLENAFNKFFWSVWAWMVTYLPKGFLSKFSDSQKAIKQFFFDGIKNLKESNEAFFKKAESLKDFSPKDKFEEKKMNALIYMKSNSPLKILKDFSIVFFALFTIFTKRRKLLLFFSFTAITLTSILTFSLSAPNKGTNHRTVASQNKKLYRAEYKSFVRRTLKVLNVSIPIKTKGKRDIHSFLTDFYVRTDTVFAKLYLDHNQHKIRNRFYENTYRMPANFPLNQDGKKVIKEKITFELNRLLKENRVEGKVLEISFDAPVAN